MSRMYGDLTPFPHDVDFVALLRDGVSCAVQLASAQSDIESVQLRQEESREIAKQQREDLTRLYEQITKASESVSPSRGSDLATKAADQIVTAGRRLVDSALCQLCSEFSENEESAEGQLVEHQSKSFRAVAEFFRDHTPPGSALHVALTASAGRYTGELRLETSLGLDANFELNLPTDGDWSRLVRVEDLETGIVIHWPQHALYQGAQSTMVPVRLDTFVVVSARMGPEGGRLLLREREDAGASLLLEWRGSGEVVATVEDLPSWTLCGLDTAVAAGMWNTLVDATVGLSAHRGKMLEAQFEGVSLPKLATPARLAERIVNELAPLTVELVRRSEIPGQLALREIGTARTESQTQLSQESLLQQIRTLPAEKRALFLPLRLQAEPARSTLPPPRRRSLAS